MGRLAKVLIPIFLIFAISPEYGESAVSLNDFFPYNSNHGDADFNFGDDSFRMINLSIGFKFFNATYHSTFLSGNGQVSFGRGISTFTPDCNPSSTPMIMAYWSDSIYDEQSNLFYRESRDSRLLKKAEADVFRAFPDLEGIDLNWMFIVTWRNVPFYGSTSSCDGRSKRNTYQLVLTTDGYYTFAIMYYNRIDWTSGAHSNTGGNCVGLGGKTAKAGFDYGDGKTLYTVSSSCTGSIINIPHTSNINQPGKWVFRVEANLETSTCDDFHLKNNKELKLTPNVISYAGLQPIKVDGPCLERRANATCIFHDVVNMTKPITTEKVASISKDRKEVVCPVPFFHEVGRKKMELRVTYPHTSGVGKSPQHYTGYFYALDDSSWGDHLDFQLKKKENSEEIFLTATWNSAYFKGDDNMIPSLVDLRLKIYDGEQWIDLGILKSNLANNGRYEGSINKQVLEQWRMRNGWGMPYIMMSPANTNETFGKQMSSQLFPGFRSISELFPPSFGAPCGDRESNLPSIDVDNDDDTRPCPPLLELAEIDANFEEDVDRKAATTAAAGEQVKSIKRQKISSASGRASECVYDKSGHLILIPPGGSGIVGKSSPSNIPLHFNNDGVQDFICGRNASSPKTYPIKDGSTYQRRRFARATGDPHIATFDGYAYTFNGVGEFWMVKFVDEGTGVEFKMQTRMEQYISSGQKKDASVITAVAMEEVRNGEKVRVQVTSAQRKLFVVVDAIPVDIDSKQLLKDFTMRHKSCHVTIKKQNSSSSQKETIIVTFSSSFSFQVSKVGTSEVALNIVGSVNSKFSNLVEGLMGNFGQGDEAGDDGGGDEMNANMGRPDGWSPLTTQEIHIEYGNPWIIRSEQESLFTYRPGESFRTFQKMDFVPTFEVDSSSVSQTVKNTCDQNKECIFDYVTTGSVTLANATRAAVEEYDRLARVSKKEVRICPPLQFPEGCHLHRMNNALAGVGKVELHCGSEKRPMNCTCTGSADDHIERPKWKCGAEEKTNSQPIFCERPPTLTNGLVIGTNYSTGATIQLNCNHEYKIFWKNRNFNGPGGICPEADPCPTLKYTCVEGETMLTNGTRVIIPIWSGYGGKEIQHVKCLSSQEIAEAAPKTCNRGELVSPANGIVRHSQLVPIAGVGKAEFFCDDGYQLEENGVKNCSCGVDEKWTCNGELPAKCVERTVAVQGSSCDQPNELDNGGQIIGTNYSIGASISLECNDGNTAETLTCALNQETLGNGTLVATPVWRGYGGRIVARVGCWNTNNNATNAKLDQKSGCSMLKGIYILPQIILMVFIVIFISM